MRRINSKITADNYTFDTVNEFIYLGSAVTTKNDASLEIKRRITLVNSCCVWSMGNWVTEIYRN